MVLSEIQLQWYSILYEMFVVEIVTMVGIITLVTIPLG